MPRASKQAECASPSRPQRSGNKQLAENLSKDELLKRLKKTAQELYDVEQGKSLEEYAGTATSLAKKFIVKHADKDIRLYAAYCIAQVLRIFAPDPPYEKSQLWSIFDLIIGQLEGLRNPKGSSFEKLFSLLENLAIVKTLTICIQLDFPDLILKLFKTMFSSVKKEHSQKVQNFMLDIMCSLILEAESISQQVLDTILENIINPVKTSNPCAHKLASSVIKRAAPAIEPYIQLFFNNALFFDKASESELQENLYDLIYELHRICPSVLLSVLPQLEFKLKSNDETERLEVTKMLAKMFSDEDSDSAQSHKPLWQCFLGRFVDISVNVRIECTKHAKYFFVFHPELVDDISEKLRERQRDPDEKVRMEVVTTICEAASEKLDAVPEKLFEVVTERLRDRKWPIRKDAMMCLGRLYKKIFGSDGNHKDMKKISWIPTKILHCYYQNSAEDRLCVERVFLGCLVPVTLRGEERMNKFLAMYLKLDEPGTKALNHMLRSQACLRSDLNDILKLWQEHQKKNLEETKKLLTAKVTMVARVLPDPVKTQDHLKRLTKMLSDKKFFELMKECVSSGQDCAKVSKAVSEVALKIGTKSPMFETVKALLDRAAPLLVDSAAGKHLVALVSKYVEGDDLDFDEDVEDSEDTMEPQDEISERGRKALDLLLTCITVYPDAFKFSLIFEKILVYLKRKDFVADVALRILTLVGKGLEEMDSGLSSHYQQALTKLFTKGTPSQAKLSGRAISKIYSNSSSIFQRILENQLRSIDYESSKLTTILSSLGQIALLAPSVFEQHNTTVIRDFVVKDLLMKDRSKSAKGGTMWCEENELSKETKAKIQGIKLLINWLRGLQTNNKDKIQPVLRIIDNVLRNNGDMTGRGHVRACEMSHIRLVAACGLLKIAQEPAYHEYIDIEYFQNLSSIMQDPCSHVRTLFIKKLCKGLESLKLPLEYLSFFALAAKDPSKERKQQVKQMICRSISLRNEYLRQHSSAAAHSASILPEYALPYLIYLLAHLPDVRFTEAESLKDIKAYLWFFMEPVLARGDNYNFMKKLAENVKQTKDAKAPDNEVLNKAIYTVSDIAIGIIMKLSKTHTFVLKDFPGNLVLPKKLFVPLGKGELNSKTYLPKNFSVTPMKKSSNNVSKITPSKSGQTFINTSSTGKKSSHEKTAKRISEKSKTKKTQKSLMDILEKETKESDEQSEEDEEESRLKTNSWKTKRSRPLGKQTTQKPSTKNPLSARKRSLTSPSTTLVESPNEKRTKKAPAVPLKVETPTRFSPRRNVSAMGSSPGIENIARNIRTKDSLHEGEVVNGFSQSSVDDDQNEMSGSGKRSPVKKKHQVVNENIPLAPSEQSSLIVKRKRKRR